MAIATTKTKHHHISHKASLFTESVIRDADAGGFETRRGQSLK
jgi:hypothetical protein